MIRFACPACGKNLKAPDQGAGRRTSCPRCGERLFVPHPAAKQGTAGVPGQDSFAPPIPSVPEWVVKELQAADEPEVVGQRGQRPQASPTVKPPLMISSESSGAADVPDVEVLEEVEDEGVDHALLEHEREDARIRHSASPALKLVCLVGALTVACVAVVICMFPRSSIAKEVNRFLPDVTNSTLTAKNPLLVMGFEGASKYMQTPEGQRDQLDGFCQPWTWGTFLLLGLLIGCGKDGVLTLGGPLTTPLDALALIVHWAGFVVGLTFVVVRSLEGGAQEPGFLRFLEAAIVIITCLTTYAVVFVVFSTVEAVIVVNPVPYVAAVLKLCRNGLIVAVYMLFRIHPVLGFIAALAIFVVCLWLLHFSIRVSILSTVYSVGIFRRLFGLVKAREAGQLRAFSCWAFRDVPWFSYGRLRVSADGHWQFVYKRLFLLWERAAVVPSVALSIGVGSINPYLLGLLGEKRDCVLLRFSPVYCGREEWLCGLLGLSSVEDISLKTSLKKFVRAAWEFLKDGFASPSRRRKASQSKNV